MDIYIYFASSKEFVCIFPFFVCALSLGKCNDYTVDAYIKSLRRMIGEVMER